MKIIDAHHHLWRLGNGDYPWLEGHREQTVLGDYSPICRDFVRDDYLAVTRGFEIAGTVHVEAGAGDPVRETQWLQSIAPGADDFPQAFVVACDLATPDAASLLDRHLAESPKVRSVRTLGRGRVRMFADPVFRGNVPRLAERSLMLDLRVTPPDMADAATLAAENPGVPMIVNHMGMPIDRSAGGLALWRAGMRALAAQPSVHLKLSGLVMTDHAWTLDSLRPLVLAALDDFGPRRILFGSNFPVDGLFATFADLVEAYRTILDGLAPEEMSAIFCENARALYRLPSLT